MYNALFEYDNALTEEQCKNIIDLFESSEHKKQGVVGTKTNVDTSIKRSIDLNISPTMEEFEKWKEIDTMLCNSIDEMLEKYIKHIQKEFEDVNPNTWLGLFTDIVDTGYNIQRTEPGGFYKWHHDFCVETVSNTRILTFIWYLNDVNPEDGGSTEFVGGKKIQPKTGKFIFFPATWTAIHRGNLLKRGKKYIVTGWLHTKVTS